MRPVLCLVFVSGCAGLVQDLPIDCLATGTDAGPEAAVMLTDGGPPDAAVTMTLDAGTDAGTVVLGGPFFGASRCDASFLVCDGFEGDTFNPALWTYYPPSNGAFARQDDTQAARGNRALHLRSGVQLRARDQWPWLQNGFHLRAFMRWGHAMPDWHLTYFWVTAPGEAFTIGSYHNQLGMNEYGPNNGDTGVAARDVLPVGRWACIEWEVKPSNNEVHVWMDEEEVPAEPQNPFQVPNMHVTNWPPMRWVDFSIDLSTSNPNDELWIDELALSTSRIGCSR